MTDIRAKVAYLHGLAEGLEIDTTSGEGRVLTSVLDVLGDLAEQVTDMAEAQDELAEYVEDVDHDLGELEQSLYGEEEEIRFIPEEEIVQEEDGVSVLTCPGCGEILAASMGEVASDLNVVCPTCGTAVYEADLEYEEGPTMHGVD